MLMAESSENFYSVKPERPDSSRALVFPSRCALDRFLLDVDNAAVVVLEEIVCRLQNREASGQGHGCVSDCIAFQHELFAKRLEASCEDGQGTLI